MNVGMHSTIGPRDNLEDMALASEIVVGNANMPVLILTDGVGGCDRGEVASATAVQSVHASLGRFAVETAMSEGRSKWQIEDVAVALYQALLAANDAVLEKANSLPDDPGMATTIVFGVIVESTLVLGWAGDSRCYLRSETGLRQLSLDHTETAVLVRSGRIGEVQARNHPGRHTVTQYLGKPDGFEPELIIVPIERNDSLLLCSDGLTDVLTDAEIDSLLTDQVQTRDLNAVAQALVRAAIERGTGDNTTALVYRHTPWGAAPLFARTCTGDYAAVLAARIQDIRKEYSDAFATHEPASATVVV